MVGSIVETAPIEGVLPVSTEVSPLLLNGTEGCDAVGEITQVDEDNTMLLKFDDEEEV